MLKHSLRKVININTHIFITQENETECDISNTVLAIHENHIKMYLYIIHSYFSSHFFLNAFLKEYYFFYLTTILAWGKFTSKITSKFSTV